MVKIKVLAGLVLVMLLSVFLAACEAGTPTPSIGNTATTAAAQTTTGGNVPANTTTAAAQPASVQQQQGGTVQPTGRLEDDIKQVVKAANPAVVLVSVVAQSRDIFGRITQGQGVGTGSIITQDGFIVTNNHVIENSTNINVTLADGRNFAAQVVGKISAPDLAVLKIEGQNFPTIPLGNSDNLEVGDWVVAIGNALGLRGGSSVTAGIVSAKNRSIDELTSLIQTDAAINPGNSGGPLLNLRGELIGINTATATSPLDGGAAQNIGFALSINQVKPYIEGFMKGQPVQRPYIGIDLFNVNPTVAGRYNLPVQEGVLITEVSQASPAASAGLKAGDVIIAMNEVKIASTSDLSRELLSKKPGEKVTLRIVSQGGGQREVQLTLGTRPNP
jgi:S1-C subfamily serine protease